VSNALKETLSTELHKVFNAYQFIIGHFVVKAANNNSTFPLHQDWNITEEKSFASVHCWIPLQDTFKENGAMHIVPGSHLFFNNYRSGSLSIPRISEQKGYDSLVKEIKLGKGQALIYHPALFHGSYENKTSENRIAILVSLIEKSAPMQYFHATENNEIEIYNFTPEYLLENLPTLEKGVKPQGILPVQTIKNQQTSNNLISFQHLQQKNKESTLNFVKRFIQFWK
jgi:ectoine hydroxylase-related dioxygenase (phytanoyl-CoA dioxygenase family)